MLCQLCGLSNRIDSERCQRCATPLLVISGPGFGWSEPAAIEDEPADGDPIGMLEHLFDRIGGIEENLEGLRVSTQRLAERTAVVDHSQSVTQAGVEVLADLLERHGLASRKEIDVGWERSLGRELANRELARRFEARQAAILAHATARGEDSASLRRHLHLVELALLGNQVELARRHLTTLVRLDPGNPELWSFIADAALTLDDLDAARVAWTRVMDLRGASAETLIQLGSVLCGLGELDDARRCFEGAGRIEPGPLPKFTIAALDVLEGDHRSAIGLLSEALEVERAPSALYLLGLCELELGHTGRACGVLEEATDAAPEFSDALFLLGIAYHRRGWSRRAATVFQTLAEIEPGDICYGEGRRLLDEKPRRHVGDEAAELVRRADQVLSHRGPATEALGLLGQALRSSHGEPGLAAELALMASVLGRPRLALETARQVLEGSDTPATFRAAAALAVLETLRRSGRARFARSIGQRLLGHAEDSLFSALINYELACAEAELGEDPIEAERLARGALEALPRGLARFPLEVLAGLKSSDSGDSPAMTKQLDGLWGDRHEHAGGPALDEVLLAMVRRLGALIGRPGAGTVQLEGL